jgi:hypothetical protein
MPIRHSETPNRGRIDDGDCYNQTESILDRKVESVIRELIVDSKKLFRI